MQPAGVQERARSISADRAGSSVDGSAVTELGANQGLAPAVQLQATNGGSVDPHAVTLLSDGNASLLAANARSHLDVSGITVFTDTGPASAFQSTIEARDGGTVVLAGCDFRRWIPDHSRWQHEHHRYRCRHPHDQRHCNRPRHRNDDRFLRPH